MMKLPASNTTQIFILMFVAVLLILVGGAVWIKQTSSVNNTASQESSGIQQEQAEPIFETVTLRLTPTSVTGTYAASIEGLTAPINGVAFQLEDPAGGAELTGTEFEMADGLEETGWSSAINSTSDSATGATLSFSILKTEPAGQTTETISSLPLGTISFSNIEAGINDMSLIPTESFVTYASGSVAKIELVVQ